MRYTIIIFLRKLKRLFLERLPIDIYNLRIEYQSSALYRTMPEDEEDKTMIKLLFLESNSIQIFITIELKQ